MLRFHIRKDTTYDSTVIKQVVYSPSERNDIEITVRNEDGIPFHLARDFSNTFLKNENFVCNYEEIKKRIPKDDMSISGVHDKDYYEFKPKGNAERFVLMVDKNIKDYDEITADIEDAALTIKMSQKEELKKLRVKNICVGIGAAAAAGAAVLGVTWAVFYAANGYQEPFEVLKETVNMYGDVAQQIFTNTTEAMVPIKDNLVETVNNIKVR